jgi:hypothetical protein
MAFVWISVGALVGWMARAMLFRAKEADINERGRVVAQLQDYLDSRS